MCFVELHKLHECSDVNKVADEFRKQMTSDMRQMTDTIDKCNEVIAEQEKNIADFINHVEKVEKEINQRAEILKIRIDAERKLLIKELTEQKEIRLKQMQTVVEDIKQGAAFVDSLVKYTQELRDKGSASDVAQQARILHDRAAELAKLDDMNRTVSQMGSVEISLEIVDIPTMATGSMIGKFKWQHFIANSPASM
jgi:replication initiation and membrane attachment protein DnaB